MSPWRFAVHRPVLTIMVTMIAVLLGAVAFTPLALGLGEGGEAQAPMARAVIGGLMSSTLITLVIVPVVYSLFEGLREKGRGEDDLAPATERTDGYAK